MGRCIIFCAGRLEGPVPELQEDDLIIAADGGMAHMERLGLQPDVTLGDFDSLGYTPEGAEVFPVEKDDTDAMLAVRRGLSMGYTEFLLYGALEGDRLDHTLANYQLLQFLKDRGANGYLVGKTLTVTVASKERLRFTGAPEGLLSVFCMGAAADGITLTGLKYPLQNGSLTPGFPLGVGNRFLGCEATVEVKNGSLLVFYDRNNGFPLREK